MDCDVYGANARAWADGVPMQDADLDLVTCPTCGTPFELSAAMQDTVTRRVAVEQGKIRQLAEATARERVTLEMQAMLEAKDAELAAAQLRSAEALQREADVARRARELDDREQQAALDIQRTLAAERIKIREQADVAARERYEAHAKAAFEAKDAELAAALAQVADATKRETELARRARELDDRAQQAQLEIERTLTDERAKIRQQAEEAARVRFDAQAAAEREAKDAELAAARAQIAAALATKEEELSAARAQVADAAKRETELVRRARELDDLAQQAQLDIERTLADERAKIRQLAEEAARARFDAQATAERETRDAELAATRAQTAAALEAKDDELRAARTQVADAAKRETELARRARELDERAQQAQLDVERTLADERAKIRQLAEETARARFDAQAAAEREARDAELEAARAQIAAALEAKDDELSAARAQVADAAKRETELARRARELDDRAQQAQLDIERTLAGERAKIRQLAEETARARFETQAVAEREARDAELAAAQALIVDARKREADLIRQTRDLDERVQQAQMDIERTLTAERAKIRLEAEAAAHARLDGEIKADRAARDAELAAARSQVAALTEREIEVLKRTRELEAREQEQRLAFERRLSQETAQVKEATEATVREHLRIERERHDAQAAEHHLQLEGLKRKLAEAQQKLSTATPYVRGETQEIQLRELLRRNFHRDRVEDVPVGTAGSDVVQGVTDELGREAGVIVWESKNTKLWSDEWLAKLRDDQRALGAEVAVLVSTTLPPDVRVFALKEGVWVTSWQAAAPLAAVLRRTLLEVASVRNTNSSRGEKMSMLYDYLTGAEFRNRFTGVIEAYQEMQEDLDDEKRAVLTLWKKRERQLKRAIENLAAFYGDVQGIAGSQLADIEPLMLPSSQGRLGGAEGPDHDEDEVDVPPDLRRTLAELLYELIPADGSTVGNKSLCSRFVSEALVRHHVTVGEAEYRSCKDMLLQLGRIRRGAGKGGSVARL